VDVFFARDKAAADSKADGNAQHGDDDEDPDDYRLGFVGVS